MDEPMNKLISNIRLAKLILKMVNLEDKVIEPEINPAYPKGYRYTVAEEYLGKNTENELEELANEDLLEREFFSKELGCPKDSSINLSFKRHCPNCNSTNVTKKELIEHTSCGYVGPETNYKDNKCPKCGRDLGKLGVDHIKHGMQYVCANCENFFQEPIDKAVCLKDRYSFPISDAKEIDLYKYKLTQTLLEEVNKAVDQQRYIGEKLKELGFRTESPAAIKGRSGVTHEFFMIAATGGGFVKTKILLEILGDTEITKNDIFNIYAKATDAGVQGALVGAIPKMSEDAKSIANSYKLAYVEGEDISEIAEKMVFKFAELIETPEDKMMQIFGALGEERAA